MSELETPPLIAGEAVEAADNGSPLLIGSECADCGTRVFPPVAICPECMSENLRRIALSPTGTLYSWSVVHVAPRGWTVPYIAGYVDLPDGVRVFSHIVGADQAALEMDMNVALCTATLGTDNDGNSVASYAFAPVAEGDANA